jgi:trehalose synthase
VQEVTIGALPADRFAPVVGPERMQRLSAAASSVRELLGPASVWNLNSTAAGGGVAEMLQPLLAYVRGEGIDARWLVIDGDAEFFRITKRLHNGFHGEAGDGGALDAGERRHYEEVLRANAEQLRALVRPGDVVLLHDPQTAGLVEAMARARATVIWRSHIGSDRANELVDRSWAFLRPFLDSAQAIVFSRSAYVPDWLQGDDRVRIVAPSIDPFSPKNQELDAQTVRGIVGHIGVVADGHPAPAVFLRRDGSRGRVDHFGDIVRTGPAPDAETPLVVQVSRWDRLKDMRGLLQGFAEHVVGSTPAHLALVGPNVSGVADDPEGAEVLEECFAAWRDLPHAARARIQLVCLPMADVEENAAIVNAIQRHATVVVQKSLAEGFGLTVAEAMWKAKPVVASAVGGIQDQILDGQSGLLLADPTDHEELGSALVKVLADPDLAQRLGTSARRRTCEHFLGSRHLVDYAELLTELLAHRRRSAAPAAPDVGPAQPAEGGGQ